MNTFEFLNNSSINVDSFLEDMLKIRTKLFSVGVCWIDSVSGCFKPDVPFRVVLFTRHDNVDFKNPMVKECNGLVFEYHDGWNLLAMPQWAFCTNKISMRRLINIHNSGEYDVFEVLDATILTLYFYNGEWRISSTKSYDIGSIEMIKGMTFMEAIKDLMKSKYCAFNFESLHTNCSYTIALRHSKYHIFDETKHLANRTRNVPRVGVDMNSYIMVMAIANLETHSFVGKHVAGLPSQNPITLRGNSVSMLINYAHSAYAKYAKAHQLQNFKYKPLYGYILRAKNQTVPDEYSTIFIESELYRAIKSGLYKNNASIREGNFNKLVVQMSTNFERYEQFQIMFGKFSDKFEELKNKLDTISVAVINRMVDIDDEPNANPILEAMISDLANQFKTEHDITLGIIRDAFYSKSNIKYLYALMDTKLIPTSQ